MSLVPGKIQRLDENVVNRIAAGEVIQRPSNALKELLENALDAKATSITVVLNQGGLKLLQITDNGTGINRGDLPILCERFTTSKLQSFEDLKSISTFGFRGEALASVSHVAKLTVLTKTADEKCGYRTSYCDGKPVGTPVPCAANQGTQILVEDMFFNVPTRRKALKSGSEEFHRVADVVSRYAIHNSGVSFNLKKLGDPTLYVRTQKEASKQDNVGSIFGPTIAKELVEISCEHERLKFKMSGLISNVNFNTKKFNFLLFINNRLVECSGLKKAIEMVYSAYLPKGTHPFVYMSLDINPANVDVNVHPTKHEVHFLHQDQITEQIQKSLDSKLLSSNSSRTFFTMPAIQQSSGISNQTTKQTEEIIFGPKSNLNKNSTDQPKNMVRTDAKEQKMDRFVTKIVEKNSEEIPVIVDKEAGNKNVFIEKDKNEMEQEEMVEKCEQLNRREIKLASLKNLQGEVEENCHSGLKDLITNHSYVGLVNRQFSLIQHNVKLFMVDNQKLSEELFYQLVLRDFGNFDAIKLDPPASIKQLALIALESEDSGWTEADGNKDELSTRITECLIEKSEMLDDYFSLETDTESGEIKTIPNLVEDFVPHLGLLPMFVMRLATEVNWDEEEACFDTFAREIAKFYSIRDIPGSSYDCHQHSDQIRSQTEEALEDKIRIQVEQSVFAKAKSILRPPKSMLNERTFIEVANLPDLYKVFERC